MIVLGLDVSASSTGWSVIKNGRFYKREGVDFGWIKTSSSSTLSERLHSFREQLIPILEMVKPDRVGIEDVFLARNPKTMKLLARFGGVAIEAVRATSGLESAIVTVKEIRSIFGTQGKQETFDAVIEKYKLDGWSYNKYNDVTDSLAVSFYVYKN